MAKVTNKDGLLTITPTEIEVVVHFKNGEKLFIKNITDIEILKEQDKVAKEKQRVMFLGNYSFFIENVLYIEKMEISK